MVDMWRIYSCQAGMPLQWEDNDLAGGVGRCGVNLGDWRIAIRAMPNPLGNTQTSGVRRQEG